MAITIIVEDGTGLTNATSYVSIAEFEAYWTARGVDYTATSEDTLAIWLNLASQFADANYDWDGQIASDEQALNIPRVNWCDKQGRDLDDTVPTFIKNGICELAAIRQSDNFETTATTGVKSESYGPVSVTYSGDSGSSKVLYTTATQYFKQGLAPVGLRVIPT
jgi:hypothetical protein